MRITQGGIYNNFLKDQADAKIKLDRFTKQISSGKKIDKSYQDSKVYVDSMRLDTQISQFKNIQDRVEKSKLITNTTDSSLSSMTDILRNFKTKLIEASNGTLSNANLKSLATELKEYRDDLVRISNTSVNGEYIFSGTAVNTKPINENGIYQGNDKSLKTELSNGVDIDYSIDGKSLFFGLDQDTKKTISTNKLLSKDNSENIKLDDDIKDLFDKDSSSYYFYVDATTHDGESIKNKISLSSDDKVSDLLDKIGETFGKDSVDVSLSEYGNIEITDKKNGASMLNFNLKGSDESVDDLSSLNYKVDFNISDYQFAKDGVDDSAYFKKDKNSLSSNISLITDNNIAKPSTKLTEISKSSLDSKTFIMNLTDINGNDRDVKIDLSNSSTFTLDGQSFDIYDANLDKTTNQAVKTKADDFTLSQLNSIISLAMSGKTPTSNDKDSIEDAIKDAKGMVDVKVDSSGKLQIEDLTNSNKDIKFSLYDKDSSTISKPTSISFMSNKSIVSKDPQINFFKDLDQVINSIEHSIKAPGANSDFLKNISIKDSLSKIDILQNHIGDKLTKVGAIEKNLDSENSKAQALELSTTELKSKIDDIDIAKTIIEYQQLSVNYQAMLSTVSKVNSLSLLNYIR